jgi:hypothetical protein
MLVPLQRPGGSLAIRHSTQAGHAQQLEERGVVGLQAFFRWVNREQLAGEITFEVKQGTAALQQ